MKTRLMLLILLLVFTNRSYAQCDSFDGCYDVGYSAYQEENYEGAITYLTNAINLWQKSDGLQKLISAYNYRANSYAESSMHKNLRDNCKRILIIAQILMQRALCTQKH